MALLQNIDLKDGNNKIVQFKKKAGGGDKQIYYVNDLGASLGSIGDWLTLLQPQGEALASPDGFAKDYVKRGFIESVKKGEVQFRIVRREASQALEGVKVEHARWMGNLLGRLSDKQLTDAFRTGGFSESDVAIYVKEIRDRIRQLQNLESGAVTPD